MWNVPTIVAHRGVRSLAPENSLAAIRLAKQYADWIEIDATTLGDGTVVIYHDATLQRCSLRNESLLDLSQADLSQIEVGSHFAKEFQGEPLPTLKDALYVARDCGLSLNLELKLYPETPPNIQSLYLQNLVNDLRQYWTGQLLTSSFNIDLLEEFSLMYSYGQRGCLYEQQSSCWEEDLRRCQAQTVIIEHDQLNHDYADAITQQGHQVGVFTLNNVERARMMALEWGVTGIITDYPQNFVDFLKV